MVRSGGRWDIYEESSLARKPAQIEPPHQLSAAQMDAACYVGSSEHKTARWWGGLPDAYVGSKGTAARPKKQLTTICPLVKVAERDMATRWVHTALRSGQMKRLEGDKDFPSRIWYHDLETGQIWIGYCVNSVLGQYKGWPISEDERVAVFG